jgi:hypothetical protein
MGNWIIILKICYEGTLLKKQNPSDHKDPRGLKRYLEKSVCVLAQEFNPHQAHIIFGVTI